MRENQLKAKLAAGHSVYGTFLRYNDPALMEFVALQGWDFIVLDAEHAANEVRDAENLCRAAELRASTPMVRVPAAQRHIVLRFLDSGVHGLHAPLINTVADAEELVQFVKYPPLGQRGLAAVRAADYGQLGALPDYVDAANAQTLVVVQIETREAIANAAAIAAVEGVDVLFVGLTDLSSSLGHRGDSSHAEVLAYAECATNEIVASGKTLGVVVGNHDQLVRWKECGARYFVTTFEAVYGLAARRWLEAARS